MKKKYNIYTTYIQKQKMLNAMIMSAAGVVGFSIRYMEPNYDMCRETKISASLITGGLFSASAYCFLHYPLISTITTIGYVIFGVQDIGQTLFPCF